VPGDFPLQPGNSLLLFFHRAKSPAEFCHPPLHRRTFPIKLRPFLLCPSGKPV
jgi:hypothetical protein